MLCFVLASCKDEEHDTMIWLSGESADLIREGIRFDSNGGVKQLYFNYPADLTPEVGIGGSDGDWLSAIADVAFPGECRVEVAVAPNYDKAGRSGEVIIVVGDDCLNVNVSQEAYAEILIDRTAFDVDRKGGEVVIRCRSTKEIRKPSVENEWLSVREVRKIDDDGYEVIVTVDENVGPGRIEPLYLSNGSASLFACIVQRPGVFGKFEVIHTDYRGGDLEILLGYSYERADDGMTNIHRIKRLVIEGGINDNDLDVLKAYTASADYPVTLDLTNATFKSGAWNPYGAYSYVHSQKKTDVTVEFDNYVPARMFGSAYGLTEYIFSDDTRGICGRAFESTPMKRVIIPGNVVYIGDYAFKNCVNLTELYIRKWSNLETLGVAPFSTGNYLESLYLSWHLSNVSPQAFEGLMVKNLYLDKYDPPVWRPEGAVIDTLYIPEEELVDVYRSAPGWGGIHDIRAWSYEWEDSPYPPSFIGGED